MQNRHQVSVNALRMPVIHIMFFICSYTVAQTYIVRARKRHILDPERQPPMLLKMANTSSDIFESYKIRMLDIRKRNQ